ncbi:MAG: ATP-binding protein, partial [Mycoplasmataceae bacterium]|nr:ATP-binding protein [Mycoplasmataceae bacterium]
MSKRKIYMNYNNYISMSTNKTSKYLMFSEFIDNSIASFEVKYGEKFKEWDEKIKIEIKIDIKTNGDSKQNKVKIHGKYIRNDSHIKVSDNAFGMKGDILYDALQIDNKKILEGSNKNVHGRGMKQAAFFFGLSLFIETNNGKESNEINFDLTKIGNLSSDVELEVRKSNFKNRGTTITLSNLYDSKLSISTSEIKEIEEALKTRYWNYLKTGKLSIMITTDILGGTKTELSSTNEEPLYLNVKDLDSFYSGKDRVAAEKMIIDHIDNLKLVQPKTKIANLDPENEMLIKDTIKKMYTTPGLYRWEYKDVSFGFLTDSIKLDMKFWRNGAPINYGPYRGIYIIQGGRAIKHGPNGQAYLDWYPTKSHSSGSTDNLFFGEIDITNIDQIIATNDKSDIEIETDIKNELDSFIYWNWYVFNKVENFIRNEQNQAKKSITPHVVENNLNSRFSSFSSKEKPNLPYSE